MGNLPIIFAGAGKIGVNRFIFGESNLESDFERLGAVPLFHGLGEKDIQAIIQAGYRIKVPEGSYLFYQDDPAEYLFVLVSGRVKLGQITPDGQQIILNMIGTWEMFGLVAFTEGGTYPVSAQAMVDCEVIRWSHKTLQDLSQGTPALALNAMQVMAKRVHDFQDQIRELSTERVERRLARVLLRLVGQVGKKSDEGVLIDLPLTRQDLAEMSGTTLFTVSRILSQWDREGLVQIGRERVVIRFPHGLVRIAEDVPGGSADIQSG